MASTTYTVKGMTCEHCARAVTDEMTKIPGVRDVSVDLEAGRVSVESDAPLPGTAVAEAVDEAGYDLVPAE